MSEAPETGAAPAAPEQAAAVAQPIVATVDPALIAAAVTDALAALPQPAQPAPAKPSPVPGQFAETFGPYLLIVLGVACSYFKISDGAGLMLAGLGLISPGAVKTALAAVASKAA